MLTDIRKFLGCAKDMPDAVCEVKYIIAGILNGQPIIQNVDPSNLNLSAIDFDRLLDNAQSDGYDNANYREYLVVGSRAIEYYPFEQDAANRARDGSATWAIPSNDNGALNYELGSNGESGDSDISIYGYLQLNPYWSWVNDWWLP